MGTPWQRSDGDRSRHCDAACMGEGGAACTVRCCAHRSSKASASKRCRVRRVVIPLPAVYRAYI